MERNIFKLEQEQLKEIALTLQKKVEEGLANTMSANIYYSQE